MNETAISAKLRSKYYSHEEKKTLINLVLAHKHIIECKETDVVTKDDKLCSWTIVSNEFNLKNNIHRSDLSLQMCWDNLKKSARKYKAARMKDINATGGGKTKVSEDALLEMVLSVINEKSCSGIPITFDGDKLHNKENCVESILIDAGNSGNDSVFQHLVEKGDLPHWTPENANKLLNTPLNTSINDVMSSYTLQKRSLSGKSTSRNEILQRPKRTKCSCESEQRLHANEAHKPKVLNEVKQTDETTKKRYKISLLKAQVEREKKTIEFLDAAKDYILRLP